ncbi:hypothetical protein [Streptomyces tauricus]|uniref:hypothetical protein n=1 Tax=Streptomyces tauricus TaxID=68274 RepID=UPI002242FAEB|nr:hypothetical protein [Streptomyces tauricus]MCW8096892.1 hypothetical protein [Streptomyces tauricus]
MTLGYDAAGRSTTRANATMSEDFVYNLVGNLTKTRGFAYTYDPPGRCSPASTPTATPSPTPTTTTAAPPP